MKLVHKLEEHLGNVGSGEWVSKSHEVGILRKEIKYNWNTIEALR
jgi:hypothetical protein